MVGVCLKTRVSPRNRQSSQLCSITRGGDQEGDSMTPVATSESRYTPGIYTLLYCTHYEVYPKTYPITYPRRIPNIKGHAGTHLVATPRAISLTGHWSNCWFKKQPIHLRFSFCQEEHMVCLFIKSLLWGYTQIQWDFSGEPIVKEPWKSRT